MSVSLYGFGHNESVNVTGAKTLAAADQGIVQNVTATATVTLPATAASQTHTVRVGAPGITVTVSPNSADQIIGNGFTAADDKDLIFTNQPAGSFVTLSGNGGTGWVVTAISGTATRQA